MFEIPGRGIHVRLPLVEQGQLVVQRRSRQIVTDRQIVVGPCHVALGGLILEFAAGAINGELQVADFAGQRRSLVVIAVELRLRLLQLLFERFDLIAIVLVLQGALGVPQQFRVQLVGGPLHLPPFVVVISHHHPECGQAEQQSADCENDVSGLDVAKILVGCRHGPLRPLFFKTTVQKFRKYSGMATMYFKSTDQRRTILIGSAAIQRNRFASTIKRMNPMRL